MDPDRFTEIHADEQRAVVAINEEYRRLQDHVPVIVGEVKGNRGRMLVAVIVLMLVVSALAVGVLLR